MPADPAAGGRRLRRVLEDQRADTVPTVVEAATVLRVVERDGLPTSDGQSTTRDPLLVVRWRGADIPVPYLASYVPTQASVGDVVALQTPPGGRQLCLGRIAGTP